MDPEDASVAVQISVRWQQLEPFRDEDIDSMFKSILNVIGNKFHGAELLMRDGDTQKFSGYSIAESNKIKMILSLNPDKELNRDFLKLLYAFVLSLEVNNADSLESGLKVRDISVLLDLMQYNNMLRMNRIEPASTIDGLKYFWDHYQKESSTQNEAAQNFIIFVSEIAHTSKRVQASDQGYLETLNVLAVRHQNNKDDFRELMADDMISKVSW